MKRSKQIRLVLLGGVATGMLAGCDPSTDTSYSSGQISTNGVYTNDHYVGGRGYYHAPYHAWFPHPYNYYVPGRGYFHGGYWTPQPFNSPITVSQPKETSVTSSSSRSSKAFGVPGSSSSSSSSKSSTTSGGTSRGGFGNSSHSSGS